MGKKVDAVTKELEQLTTMCVNSLHDAAMRWQTFEQCNSKLFDCNMDLLKRIKVLEKQGKVGSDIHEMADGDKEAAWYLKMHSDLRGSAVAALSGYKKAITLLVAYDKRITVVIKSIKGLITDRAIGLKSPKSLPLLQKTEKAITKLGTEVASVITLSNNMPKLNLDL